MEIEARMDEFQKVADTRQTEDPREIDQRMSEFEQVDKKPVDNEDKESTLPFGIKRYKNCPYCGEFMEIHRIDNKEAVYRCKGCKKEIRQKTE